MLDNISRYVSLISLSMVAAMSIFNIGYFWKIGLHFLGLVDLTNIVYSFGLAQSFIFVLLVAVTTVMRVLPYKWALAIVGLVGACFSTWGISQFSPRTLQPQLIENGAILLGFAMAGSAWLAGCFSNRPNMSQWDRSDLFVVGIVAGALSFQGGVFAAAIELSDRITYSIVTKDEVLQNARILRSSSAGFIIAAQDNVMFVPHSEIRSVKASAPRVK